MEVNDIIERVDILEYIQQFCDMEERGGEWWGLSPFKDEKTPSFSVSQDKQRFYDFSSGIGGNIITFIEHFNKCDFKTALKILMKYANIEDDVSGAPKRLESARVAGKYRKSERAIKASKVKSLPSDYMEQYEFNRKKLDVWAGEGISYPSMERFGVRYDAFSNRIVFPIKDYDGNIINVCGRTLDPNYKENGVRKYTYFKPLGCLDTIFGFSDNKDAIIEQREIILFEGSKSVMIADGWGIKNACAILTSHLNPQQLVFLIKLGVRVVFALDEEININEDVNINRLKRYVTIEWVKNRDNLLQPKMAPVDAGYEVWQTLYKNRKRIN